MKYAAGVATAIAFLLPVAASASAVTNQVTLNGGPNATVALGDTVQGNVNVTMTSNTDWESFSWQIVDSAGNAALPAVCIDSADHTSAGVFNSSFPIGTGGQSEGTWMVKIRLYGDTGVGVDNQCNTPSDLLDTFTSPEILTITSPTDSTTQTGNPFNGNSNGFCALFPASCVNGNTGLTNNTGFGGLGGPGTSLSIFCQQHPTLCGITSPTPGNQTAIDALTQQIANLTAIVTGLVHSQPTPPTGGTGSNNSANCTTLNGFLANAQAGMRSQANVALQGFLLSKGASIPALAAGASFGYFGPQTSSAVNAFQMANGCN